MSIFDNTAVRSDIELIVSSMKPVMIEIYRKCPELTQAGFVFDRYGRVSCYRDKETKDMVKSMLSVMSVADFAKEYGQSLENMGYRLLRNGDVIPMKSVDERFASMIIDPLGDLDSTIRLEDQAYRICLKQLAYTKNREILATQELLNGDDSSFRLITAVPWRFALAKLYMVFTDEQQAIAALEKAKPIEVLGLTLMVRIFADHLNVTVPFDWFKVAMPCAYYNARRSYAA